MNPTFIVLSDISKHIYLSKSSFVSCLVERSYETFVLATATEESNCLY
jgi:hypothetical protein